MGLLEKLLKGSKTKVTNNKEQMKAKIKQDLKGLLYEDELVEELLPVFESLSNQEGFEKVMELLTTKEKQIEAISGGSYFEQESEDFSGVIEGEEEEEESGSDPLLKIIEERQSK